MFKVGQIFKKNGKEICIIELLNYDNKSYAFCSIEDMKLDYVFYEINILENRCSLDLVIDKKLNNILFTLVESSEDYE